MATAFQELGGKIREKREAAGLSIEEVAARIKISSRILKAIEEGADTGLPHAVYTKRFTKAFGLLVGCDPEELDARLEDVFRSACLEESKHEPVLNRNADMAYPGTARRFIALLAFMLVLWGFAGGCWYIAVNYGSSILEFVKQPFSAFGGHQDAPPPPGGASSGTGIGNAVSRLMRSSVDKAAGAAQVRPDNGGRQAADPVPRPGGNGPPESASSSPQSAVPPAQAGVHASGTEEESAPPPSGEGNAANGAAPATASAGGERAAAGGGNNNQVLVVSRETCWMSSRADGAKGRDYVLKPGDRFVLTYNNDLELILGNAGGVDLVHNGKNYGPGGQRGQKAVLHFPEKTR
jgi:cytoskeleton protein RodZ